MGEHGGEIKTSKTLSLPISVWQLIEQIQNEKGFKNVDEAIAYSISGIAEKEGFSSRSDS